MRQQGWRVTGICLAVPTGQGRRRSSAITVCEAQLGLAAGGSWQPVTAALDTSKESLRVHVLQAPA